MNHVITAYPHNDLLNLCFHNLSIIRQKVNSDNHEGIVLDCMNCLTSLAFAVESVINFIGNSKIDTWKERNGYYQKLKQIYQVAGLKMDEKIEPLATLKIIKEFRDSIAHGKPIINEVKISNKLELKKAMDQPWDTICTAEFLEIAYSAVREFVEILFKSCGIDKSDTITKAIPK